MLPIIRPLSADEKKFVGRTWFVRARREAHLNLRFSSLFQALRAHQATPTVVTLAEQTANDCAKHSETYLSIAQEFGVTESLPESKRMGPLGPLQLSITERIIYELVALSCVQETLTGCLMGQIYQRAKYPRIRLTAHLVFQDEIWHSRLGWAHLGNVANQSSVAWLSPHVPSILELAKSHELFAPNDPQQNIPYMNDYGELSSEQRIGVIKEGLQTIVLPGLESMGIDIEGGRSWVQENVQQTVEKA